MDFTNIPNNTTWQDAAGDVTLNFKRVGVEIDKVNNQVNNINTEIIDPKDKGYFLTEAALKAKYPTPKDGYQANVAGTIYAVENGAWVNTGKKAPTPELNLNGYVKANTIYNVSQTTGNYAYADKQTARNAVPADKRALGQIISYKLATGDWIAEQYIGSDVSGWANSTAWHNFITDLQFNQLTESTVGILRMVLDESYYPVNATYTDGVINSPVNIRYADGISGILNLARNNDQLVTKIVATKGQYSLTINLARNEDGNVTNLTIE